MDRIIPQFEELQFINDPFEIMNSGFEFESKVALFPNVYFTGSFSVIESRRETGDPKLFVIGYTSAPDYFLKTGISYFIPGKMSLGVFSSYYNTPAPLDITGWQDDINPLPNAFTWITLNACYNLADWLKVKLYIRNVLDQEVYFPDFGLNSINSIPGRSDRAFFFSTVINFGE
jgi:outer membrane receptor protein involved in Fe transport